jgi:nucleotide-binding universal stress UspA family protein
MDDPPRGVVVGYDGSASAEAAVDWAAAEARRRGVSLTVLHALDTVDLAGLRLSSFSTQPAEGDAEEITARGAARARGDGEGLEVLEDTRVANVPASLIEASLTADLIVVGRRGHGEVRSALLGSVAFTVASHAECPVVVVRGDHGLPGPNRAVVVAVDHWPGGEPQVEFAADAAASAGAPLVVVTAYRLVPAEVRAPRELWKEESGGEPREVRLGEGAADQAADGALLHARGRHPGLDVRAQIAEGAPAEVLDGQAEAAALLVVGHRGAGGFPGLRLGSVARAVLHQAPCPVAVVRPRTAGTAERRTT